jgi:hypothetical protein
LKLGLKWSLPGDFTGGLMLFAFLTAIAIVELYLMRSFQAHASSGVGGLSVAVPGGGGATPASTSQRGGSDICTRKGGKFVCYEEAKRQ